MTAKERDDTRQCMAGLLKVLAIPPVVALAFASLVFVAYAASGSLSGLEFALAFIGESAAPVATGMGAVLFAGYLCAAMFFVLPTFQEGATLGGVAFAGFVAAVALRIISAVIPRQLTRAGASAADNLLLHPQARQRAESWSEFYSPGLNPQRE